MLLFLKNIFTIWNSCIFERNLITMIINKALVMKLFMLTIFLINLKFTGFSQYRGGLLNEYINNNISSIKKIIQYKGSFIKSDSNDISPDFDNNLQLEYIEYFDIPDFLTKIEYYNSDGKVRSSNEFFYENGKLKTEISDTTLSFYYSKKKIWNYFDNNNKERIEYFKDGRIEKYYIKRKCNGLDYTDYDINAENDTLWISNGYYNSKGLCYLIEHLDEKNKEILTISIKIYNEYNKIIEYLEFDKSGKLIKSISNHYEDNMKKTIYKDFLENEETIYTKRYFKDEHGNIYKSYFQSNPNSNKWSVTFLKIEYENIINK